MHNSGRLTLKIMMTANDHRKPRRVVCRGTVAALRAPGEALHSRLVLALKPASADEAAWWTVVLGPPAPGVSLTNGELRVMAVQLTPITQLDEDQTVALQKSQALITFNEALNDLRVILENCDVTEAQLDRSVEAAARQSLLQHALQRLPVPEVLTELGFLPDKSGLTAWDWYGLHAGHRMQVSAMPDGVLGNQWVMLGQASTTGTRMSQERRFHWDTEVCRGELAALVASFWREAFGAQAPVPAALSIGELYEGYCRDLAKIPKGPPAFSLDGQAFRALRRMLMQRYPADTDVAVNLTVKDGMMVFTVDGQPFGIPGSGVWLEERSVPLKALVELPRCARYGRSVVLQQSKEGLSIRGHVFG